MTEPERALQTLSPLRSIGVGLAVDDYGTGHSSLAYLHRLPLDTLKIDRSFVAEMAREGGVIVRSTVDLAHTLGLKSWPRASRMQRPRWPCARWAATSARATTTPGRCRSQALLDALVEPAFRTTVSAPADAPRRPTCHESISSRSRAVR